MKRIFSIRIIGSSSARRELEQPISTDVCILLIETKTPVSVASSGTRIYFNGVSGSTGNLTSKKDGFSLVYFANEEWTESSLFAVFYSGVAELMRMNIDSVTFLLTNKEMWKYKEAVLNRLAYSLTCIDRDVKEGYISTMYIIVPEEYKEEVENAINSKLQAA